MTTRAWLGIVATMLPLASCGPREASAGDSRKLVRSVLALLVSDGKSACVESRTRDESLAVFRQMALAPRPSRAALHWYPPLPLRPPEAKALPSLRRSDPAADVPRLREPDLQVTPLPDMAQFELWREARRLAAGRRDSRGIAIAQSWAPRGVTERWWPLVRLGAGCKQTYVVSDPVYDRGIGFVTLRSEHTGALYALRPSGSDWAVVAEWSRWLY